MDRGFSSQLEEKDRRFSLDLKSAYHVQVVVHCATTSLMMIVWLKTGGSLHSFNGYQGFKNPEQLIQ